MNKPMNNTAENYYKDSIPDLPKPNNTELATRLAHAFLQLSVADGDQAATKLTTCLTQSQEISQHLAQKLDAYDPQVRQELSHIVNSLNEELANGFIVMQFYDRIAQRIDHAVRCIKMLQSVHLESNLDEAVDMNLIQNMLTMDDEREIFSAIKSGSTVTQALVRASHVLNDTISGKDSDIELF
ncbi:MAG: hypothetical protein OEZ58_17250 [Gammaproteobacteria bacterium]|nr:hypothetical protein [Gammaproteobacteria bacterium]MDH5730738.1 hypothetical protein [Gammaproteobacteria bacterium]